MKDQRIVVTASNVELNNLIYDNRLWMTARNEPLSRRKLIEDIAWTIYNFNGLIRSDKGHKWPIPDVYEAMGEDGRWLSYYFKEVDGRPFHTPSALTLERRRILDLHYRIKYPEIARKFLL